MKCKNCNETIENDALFCDHCGAKVLKDRITLRFLLKELFASFGWDSYFILTIKKMFTEPHVVLREYVGGIRKRYLNPFTYLAISAALSLIIFNFFAEDFIKIQSSINSNEIEALQKIANQDLSELKDVSAEQLKKMKTEKMTAGIRLKVQDKIMTFFLKYFNLVMFLLIPMYAIISSFTYRKPYNFGEHIVINSYLMGTTMYVSILLFFLALLIHPGFYFSNLIFFTVYYMYALNKLHGYNLKQSILYFLRFLLVLLIFALILLFIVVILSLIIGVFIGIKNPDIFKQ
ncbi:DUF3667 domain-containing protein [Tenacibaculum jejuense]|uniref:Zinc-ribbon domain-containing protein n=1 Tax=Tenacibaculum jejuense TaxID=584609 RepID=A0A238UDY8_9FLAO|nr:DUF3667 domain-containing protein [Tenacibaculum jejuense]SNR16798.1 conserved membrane protein of unknown function [Tenacibaculum jejuense]